MERGEESFSVRYMGDGVGAVSGEQAGIGIFSDAGAGDQIAAGEEINHATQFFYQSIW